ncbi:MAG: hypothetical protein ACQEP0_14160 [Natrinema limicola]
MTEPLSKKYPEAAPYIRRAVREHGEEWVLEHYYDQLYTLSVIMEMPNKEELPFYDENEHDSMTQSELADMYQAWGEYRENLRTGTESDK